MPRDNDKNNDSPRGRRDRPSAAARAARARPGGRRRNSPSAALPARMRQARRRAASLCRQSPTAPNPMARSPIRARANPMPASAMAAPRRDDRPPRFNRDDRPRRPRSVESVRDAPAIARAKSAPIRRAAIAAMPARPRDFPTGNSATRNLMHRAMAVARSGPTRRAAKASARTATGRRAIVRIVRGHRAMATVPVAIVPNGNLAATRSFRAARRIARSAQGFGRSRSAQGFRRPPDRGDAKPWQKRDAGAPDHVGRNSRPPRDGARNFDKPRFDKPRYDKPREDRGGDERPRFSRPREDRPKAIARFDRPRGSTGEDRRNSIVRANAEGRTAWQEHPRSEARSSIVPIGRAATMRTTARSLPNARRSAAAAPIASASPDERRPPRPPREKKSGERIAKVVSRAGLASRRDAEEWIVQGRVTRQRPRDQLAGARCHRQRCRHRRRQAVAAARAHPAVHVSQAARPDDDPCRSRKGGRRCSTICRKACRG